LFSLRLNPWPLLPRAQGGYLDDFNRSGAPIKDAKLRGCYCRLTTTFSLSRLSPWKLHRRSGAWVQYLWSNALVLRRHLALLLYHFISAAEPMVRLGTHPIGTN